VLLEALVQRARAGGLERLRATVLLSNKPMLRLLQRECVLHYPAASTRLECSARPSGRSRPAGL